MRSCDHLIVRSGRLFVRHLVESESRELLLHPRDARWPKGKEVVMRSQCQNSPVKN